MLVQLSPDHNGLSLRRSVRVVKDRVLGVLSFHVIGCGGIDAARAHVYTTWVFATTFGAGIRVGSDAFVALNVVVVDLFFLLLFFFVIVRVALLLAAFFLVVAGAWLPVGKELVLEVEDPGVLEDLDQRNSLVWVFHEEPVDQVFVLLRNPLLEGDRLASLVAGNGRLVASVGSVAVHQFVEEDAEGPDV